MLAVAAISLAGCSIVDLYSERATVYNVESEQAHDQGILLNIVRASMRRPRAYTLVQKITGQATATGAATLNFPFGPRISGSNTAAVTGGASGGPTFEVATLETSDFFQSLLLPIPASLFDLYIQGEFPRDLLFNLFIEKIVMRRADGECGALNYLRTCEIVFQNYPGRRLQLELFQALAGYLVDLNLSTQPIKQQNKPKAPAESKPGSGDSKDKTQTDAPLYVLCFAPRTIETARWVEPIARCGKPEATRRTDTSATTLGRVSTVEGIIISPKLGEVFSDIINTQPNRENNGFEAIGSFTGQHVTLTIYTRSTETATYYVGEVVRTQLYPDLEREPYIVQFKVGPPFNPFPLRPCLLDPRPGDGWSCANLFVMDMNAGLNSKPAFSVDYEGTQFSVPSGPGAGANYNTRAGGSYTVLTVLRQLVIINTNAKSLPSTSVLAITTTQ